MKVKILISFTLLFITFITCFSGCKNEGTAKASIVLSEQNKVVIKVYETDGNASLMDVMSSLKESGKINFIAKQGMVTEINGKEAPERYSWFLYASDQEFSNALWGTIEYDGKTFGSAILGAESLIVIENGYYVWALEKWDD